MALPRGPPAQQSRRFSRLVHEKKHPCRPIPYLVQSIFKAIHVRCIDSILAKLFHPRMIERRFIFLSMSSRNFRPLLKKVWKCVQHVKTKGYIRRWHAPYLHLAISEMWYWSGGRGILKISLCVTVLCSIIMVHKGMSSSYRSVDYIGLWSCLVYLSIIWAPSMFLMLYM